jgi:hypothetical protein
MRVTVKVMASTLEGYLAACEGAGYTVEQLEGARIGCPFGLSWMIYRELPRRKFFFNLPGFTTDGRGYETMAELRRDMIAAMRTLQDVADMRRVKP